MENNNTEENSKDQPVNFSPKLKLISMKRLKL